jgi:hypothetical protein
MVPWQPPQETVGGWSSGTGMAGAAGAILYFLLALVLPPRTVLLLMTVTPVAMVATYVNRWVGIWP